jgi:Carboxymuconolactone decarboxylase family
MEVSSDYPTVYKRLQERIARLAEAAESPMAGFQQVHEAATADGALSRKTKELIALAIGISVRCDGCIAFRDQEEAFAEVHLDYSEIRDFGERVVGIGRLRTRGRASGAETESPVAWVVEFKNGKAIHRRHTWSPATPSKLSDLRSRRCRRRTWRAIAPLTPG